MGRVLQTLVVNFDSLPSFQRMVRNSTCYSWCTPSEAVSRIYVLKQIWDISEAKESISHHTGYCWDVTFFLFVVLWEPHFCHLCATFVSAWGLLWLGKPGTMSHHLVQFLWGPAVSLQGQGERQVGHRDPRLWLLLQARETFILDWGYFSQV